MIPRKSPLRRSGIKRRLSVKRRNAKRHRKNWLRAYGSPERVAFVRGLPCIANEPSGIKPDGRVVGGTYCGGEIENAHTATGGTGRKADAETVAPMCHKHHEQLHRWGAESFASTYQLDLQAAAAETEKRWQEHINQKPDQ